MSHGKLALLLIFFSAWLEINEHLDGKKVERLNLFFASEQFTSQALELLQKGYIDSAKNSAKAGSNSVGLINLKDHNNKFVYLQLFNFATKVRIEIKDKDYFQAEIEVRACMNLGELLLNKKLSNNYFESFFYPEQLYINNYVTRYAHEYSEAISQYSQCMFFASELYQNSNESKQIYYINKAINLEEQAITFKFNPHPTKYLVGYYTKLGDLLLKMGEMEDALDAFIKAEEMLPISESSRMLSFSGLYDRTDRINLYMSEAAFFIKRKKIIEAKNYFRKAHAEVINQLNCELKDGHTYKLMKEIEKKGRVIGMGFYSQYNREMTCDDDLLDEPLSSPMRSKLRVLKPGTEAFFDRTTVIVASDRVIPPKIRETER